MRAARVAPDKAAGSLSREVWGIEADAFRASWARVWARAWGDRHG